MISKVKAQLIQVARKQGKHELACYIALMASIEGGGNSVYLDNAYSLVKEFVTPRQWAGYLSALQKEGKYTANTDPDYAGHWGTVH